MTVIKVEKLSKTIKGKDILQDISFQVGQGECVALIGPNGAGKTTLLSCLLGDKKATKGEILVLGKKVQDPLLKSKIGILQQENALAKKFTVAELLQFVQTVSPNPLGMTEIDRLLGFSPEQKGLLTEKLSGGQRRLLNVVLCLISKPEILFLDEPTTAMDTSTRKHFWEIIDQLKRQGTTIVYSSHYIEEVEHTADRILVLHKGQLLRDTTPFAMRNHEREKYVTLPLAYREVVEGLPEVTDVILQSEHVSFKTRAINAVWERLSASGCSLEEIELQNKTLLDTLFDTTKEEKE